MTLYVPRDFRVEDPDVLYRFMEDYPFGTLVSCGPGGLHASHLPFLPERVPGGAVRLLGHLARANGHAAALREAHQVVAIFQGPHGYVSPGWYEHHPAVPTWNYAVVHAHGRVRPLEPDAVRDMLAALTAVHERGRARPWRMEDLPGDYAAKMAGAVEGFAVEVERLEGKFKLSQNRPGGDAKRVADALQAQGDDGLAAFMREHSPRARG